MSRYTDQNKQAFERRVDFGLTKRHKLVIQMIYEGKSSSEIAIALDKGIRTIEGYRLTIYKITRCKNVGELINFSLKNKIISPPDNISFNWKSKLKEQPKEGIAVLVATNGIYEKVRCATFISGNFFALDRNFSKIQDAIYWCNLPDTSSVLPEK